MNTKADRDNIHYSNEGSKFLKKLWCCVCGRELWGILN